MEKQTNIQITQESENFYVPYSMIKYFTLKQGNEYRHGLSWRVYLYLAHYHSGRLEYTKRSHLVSTFGSSHTAISKCLTFLESKGFIKVKNGWIECIGENRLRNEIFTAIGRNFNIRFEFTRKLLLNRTKFYNHLFLCIFQSSAMLRGKKRTSKSNDCQCSPHTRLNSDSVTLKGGSDLQSGFSVKNEFIQRQSGNYQAKMTNRNRMTMVKRIKTVGVDHHYLTNAEPSLAKEPKCRTALTQDGFNTKEFSPIVGFRERKPAEIRLDELKLMNTSLFNQCFVQEANHGGFVITWNMPTKYIFSIKSKTDFNQFNYKFEKIDSSVKD